MSGADLASSGWHTEVAGQVCFKAQKVSVFGTGEALGKWAKIGPRRSLCIQKGVYIERHWVVLTRGVMGSFKIFELDMVVHTFLSLR